MLCARTTLLSHPSIRQLSSALLIVAGLGLARDSFALQGGEDPSTLPVLVDKRHGTQGVHQLSLVFSTPMATKYVESTGGFLSYGINFSDLLGIEIGGGFFSGKESNIMPAIRQASFKDSTDGEPPLSDLYQLEWAIGGALVLVPLYGKISFASEIDPSYDLYLVGGGGLAGLRRQVGAAAAATFTQRTGPMFDIGVGLRFYLSNLVALRLEFRDYIYPDPASSAPEDAGHRPKDADGLTFNLQFQGGLVFTFGGTS